MAYFTGRDVRLWITTEHPDDGIRIDGTTPGDQLVTYPDVGSADTNAIFAGLNDAGLMAWVLTDVTGVDVSVGATDEDISFIGLRNVGKLEVKKDTSVSITRKKSDMKMTMLFQGKTKTNNSDGDGKHGGRHGLINSATLAKMVVSAGTTDPKSSLDDAGTAKQCFGYRAFVELKPESASGAGDGEVLVIPNMMFSEYSHTLSNDAANEESFTLTSQVKPFIYNGTKSGGAYTGLAVTQTATSLM